MLNNRSHSLAVMAVMAAAASLTSHSNLGAAQAMSLPGRNPGYRNGRRSRPQPAKGYPGAKLAKKASKGTLTHNGIR